MNNIQLTNDNDIIKVVDVTHPYMSLENKMEYKQVLPIEVINYAGLLFGYQPTTHNIYTPFKRDLMKNYKNKIISIKKIIELDKISKGYVDMLIQPDFLVTNQFIELLGGKNGNYSIGVLLNTDSMKSPIDITINAVKENITHYKCISCQLKITSDIKSELLAGYSHKKYFPKINVLKELNDGNDSTDIRNLLLIKDTSDNFIRRTTNCTLNVVMDNDTIDRTGYFNGTAPTINYEGQLDIINTFEQLKKNNNKGLDYVMSDTGQLELYNMMTIDDIINNKHTKIKESEVLEVIFQPTEAKIKVEITLFYQVYYLDSITKEYQLTRKIEVLETFNQYDKVLLLLYLLLKKIICVTPLELKLMVLTNNFTKSGITPNIYDKIQRYLSDIQVKEYLISILNAMS